jgi:hypothetical protein
MMLFTKIRTVAAWVVIPALLSMFIAHEQILSPEYCCMPWPIDSARRPPAWIFHWRNYSFVILAVAILVSLLRWQSLVGIAALVLFLFLYGSQ